jgi:hypothetical protein
METKKCKKCEEDKPLSTQHFNLLSSGSWRGTCKKCMAANTKKHYDANPSKTIARVNAYKDLLKNAMEHTQQLRKMR